MCYLEDTENAQWNFFPGTDYFLNEKKESGYKLLILIKYLCIFQEKNINIVKFVFSKTCTIL